MVAPNLNAKFCLQYMQEARRKVEMTGATRYHKRLREKMARITPPNTLTESYTQNFSKNSNLTSIQWFGDTNPYYTILHYRSIPCLKTLVHRVHYSFTACFFTLLSYTQYFYIAELYSIRTQCWGMLSLNNLLSNSQFQYVAELWPILSHCWSIHNIATLLSYNLP